MPEPKHFDQAKSEVIALLLNALIQSKAQVYELQEAATEGDPEGGPSG